MLTDCFGKVSSKKDARTPISWRKSDFVTKYDFGKIDISEKKGTSITTTDANLVTNRINLAKERLDVLKNCNCEEYAELKEIIEGKKKSKY